jgi:hypothetical protein
MKPSYALLLCGLLALPAALARGQDYSTITGYVSRAVSASDFDVNGLRVLCTGKTRGVAKSVHGAKNATVACPGELPYVGEGMAVHYTGVIADNTIYATRIDRQPPPRLGEVSESAVIDTTPTQAAAGAPASGLLIRADGYRIRITSTTKIEWMAPLQSFADVVAGDWITYHGKLEATGVLDATYIQIGPNLIGSEEAKLRAGKEYDPSIVPAGEKQNVLKVAWEGEYDPKKFPPFKDAVMQARVEKIGNNLIPAYQRALPNSDPAKIDFRFQVIDTKLFRGVLALPSGIVLVHHQTLEKVENDSQLAALLADAIACVLEKQEFRMEKELKVANASRLAQVAMAWNPLADAALGIASAPAAIELQRAMKQNGRVSLELLHDAGYDIDQAPLAWWRLALDSNDSNAMATTADIPPLVAYLYRILGETWHNPAAGAPPAH